MTSFPIVLIPSDLKSIKVAQPQDPILLKFKPSAPSLPQVKHVLHPPKRTNKLTLFKGRLIAIALSLCVALVLNITIAIIIMICLLSMIEISVYEDNKSYPTRLIKAQEEAKEIKEWNFQEKSRYKIAFDRYQEDLSEYILVFDNYQEESITYLLPEKVENFRENLLSKYFERTSKTNISNNPPRKGISEDDFRNYLVKYFSANRININVSVEKPYGAGNRIINRTSYYPDFAYIDESFGLCIDIEIDEPYTYIEKKPIHYIGTDEDRNTAFLSMRWIVIRFAEIQAVKYPDQCCKLIAETIHSYLPSEELISQFLYIEDLPLVAQWTYPEAIEMVSTSYRTTYICQDKIKQEKKLSSHPNQDINCTRCHGAGYIPAFRHIEGGRCFKCNNRL